MCYQCANRDTKEDGDGECEQSSAYSVESIKNSNGDITDYTCTNSEDTCRWRICQCDRAFAFKIKEKVKLIDPLIDHLNKFLNRHPVYTFKAQKFSNSRAFEFL